MWAVEGMEGGRIALVTKLHHCIVDGASGSSQMAGLMDLEPNPEPAPAAPAWNPPALPSRIELSRISAGTRLVGPLRLGRLLADTAKGVRDRRRAENDVARDGEERPGMLDLAPETLFSRAITSHRAVAYGSVPLDVVKRIKRAFGVTVNDVVSIDIIVATPTVPGLLTNLVNITRGEPDSIPDNNSIVDTTT